MIQDDILRVLNVLPTLSGQITTAGKHIAPADETTYASNVAGALGNVEKQANAKDDDFPMEVMTTIDNGHYHIAMVNEDGSGITTQTHSENGEGHTHSHTINGYVYINESNDHSHRLDEDGDVDTSTFSLIEATLADPKGGGISVANPL